MVKRNIHLIIPDSHSHPEISNRRYDWLSKLIIERKPSVIINLGDHWDMASLCSYDLGTTAAEAQRLKSDIDHGADALRRIKQPYNDKYGVRDRYIHYKPRWVFTCGNHEYRLDHYGQTNPTFHGYLASENLPIESEGWEFHPFLKPVIIDGVSYCHYHTWGKMNKAIGGMYTAANIVKKLHMSAAQGHSHWWNCHREPTPDGRVLIGLEAGCYLDPEQWLEYAKEGNNNYWNGITLLHDVRDGRFHVEQISMNRIREMYDETY